MSNLTRNNYNPDILETIANLSNDEVFTPPKLANKMLDLLPKEIWSDKTITFLDPAVKTGIFLREITSRLIDGLADEIPDLQERVNHILTKQVFGLGITELTTLMARRTLYCSMTANGKYSICTKFDNAEGNIVFPPTEHTFNDRGRCEVCGANEDSYGTEVDRDGMENYAYSFIHDNMKEVFGNMKFDVIIGNPPYQLDDGGAAASSGPLYHYFIDKAISMNPKYITMIVPSRWFVGGKGLDKFREKMLKETRIEKIIHHELASDCFPSVGIAGGINYFLFNNTKETYDKVSVKNIYSNGEINISNRIISENEDKNLFILDNVMNSIVNKVKKESVCNSNFSDLVSVRDPYKINDLINSVSKTNKENYVPIYNHKLKGFINIDKVKEKRETIDKNKIFISFAYGNSSDRPNQVINKPFIPLKMSVCGGTYLIIGPFDTKTETDNVLSYMQTKFFRTLVLSIKPTQHGTRKVYEFVPLQDFSKSWTDAELYAKYKLTEEEIQYIEDNIAPMGDQEDQVDLEVDQDDLEFEDNWDGEEGEME